MSKGGIIKNLREKDKLRRNVQRGIKKPYSIDDPRRFTAPEYAMSLNGFMSVTFNGKTAKERADADKRKPLTSEVKTHWTPRPFGWRKAKKACEAGRDVWAGSREGSSGCYLAG